VGGERRLHRRWLPWALVSLLGVVPVVALALPAGRRSLWRLAVIAALISIMRLIEALWLLLPSFPYRSWLQPLAWLMATVGLGGLYTAGVLWLWRREPRAAPLSQGASYG
jgi:hypothetical protein